MSHDHIPLSREISHVKMELEVTAQGSTGAVVSNRFIDELGAWQISALDLEARNAELQAKVQRLEDQLVGADLATVDLNSQMARRQVVPIRGQGLRLVSDNTDQEGK